MNFSTETKWNGFDILRWMINYFIDSLNNNTTFIDNKKRRWEKYKAKPNLFPVPSSSKIRHEMRCVTKYDHIEKNLRKYIFQVFQSVVVCCVLCCVCMYVCMCQRSSNIVVVNTHYSWTQNSFHKNIDSV